MLQKLKCILHIFSKAGMLLKLKCAQNILFVSKVEDNPGYSRMLQKCLCAFSLMLQRYMCASNIVLYCERYNVP